MLEIRLNNLFRKILVHIVVELFDKIFNDNDRLITVQTVQELQIVPLDIAGLLAI